METRYYELCSDGHTIEVGYGTMRNIRQRGHELAVREPKKTVDVRCAIDKESKLEFIGRWRPDGLFINSFGEAERLSADGQSMERVNRQ